MDDISNPLHCNLGCWIEVKDAESLLGPVVLVCDQVRDETPSLAEALGFGETKIGLLNLLLRPFALVNVRKQDVPAHNMALSVSHTSPTHTEPAVCTVGPSKTLVKLVWLTSFDRVNPQSQGAREVVWMNGVVGTPVLQFFKTLPKVI